MEWVSILSHFSRKKLDISTKFHQNNYIFNQQKKQPGHRVWTFFLWCVLNVPICFCDILRITALLFVSDTSHISVFSTNTICLWFYSSETEKYYTRDYVYAWYYYLTKDKYIGSFIPFMTVARKAYFIISQPMRAINWIMKTDLKPRKICEVFLRFPQKWTFSASEKRNAWTTGFVS